MTIHEMNDLVKTIDLEQIGSEALALHKEDAIQLNKDQLLSGIGNDARKIEPKYASPAYAKQKNRMNPLAGYGVPDLYKTGAMFEAFNLAIQNKKQYKLFSADSKFAKLVKKYPTAYGLNTESIEDLKASGYMETVVDKTKKHLTL